MKIRTKCPSRRSFKQAYSLRENGLLKVISGVTSLEEVMRVTAERGDA